MEKTLYYYRARVTDVYDGDTDQWGIGAAFHLSVVIAITPGVKNLCLTGTGFRLCSIILPPHVYCLYF